MGKHAAVTSIFLACRTKLARSVSRIVPPHEIEDIVQETYVRVCRFISKDEISSPQGLMFKIARNLALDYIKRADVKLNSGLDEDSLHDTVLPDRQRDNGARRLEMDQEFSTFCTAVRQLPVQCRRVFILKKVYGYSQREIASKLALSESTVEKHVAKGMKFCIARMRVLEQGRPPAERSRRTVTKRGGV